MPPPDSPLESKRVWGRTGSRVHSHTTQRLSTCGEAETVFLRPLQGTCHQTNCSVGVPKGSIVGFKDVSAKDMNALMQADAGCHIPVTLATWTLEASSSTLKF